MAKIKDGYSSAYLIGIDIGTSVVKSVAFDTKGNVISSARRENVHNSFGNGRAECDMDSIWELVKETLRELTASIPGSTDMIRAVSVTGYMIGAWILDKDKKPVRPAILWNDGRAVAYLEEWRKNGVMDEVFKKSCMVMNPGFTVPAARWLYENEPQTIDKADVFFFAKDWIRYKLTGEIYTEETDLSHIPGDINHRSSSEKIMSICGVDFLKELLPKKIGSDEIAGYVTPAASAETGLPAGIPVAAGMGDVSACLTGAGALSNGCATIILGTSCLCSVSINKPVFEPFGIGLSFLIPGGCTRTLPNQTGTIAIEWFLREILGVQGGASFNYSELEDNMLSKIPPGANGVIFHPYLNNTGVLAPVYEPRARARFWGLSLEHNKYDMLKAVYEGIAYAVADCFENLPAHNEPVRLLGGASKSRFWRQMFADVLGKRIVIPKGGELGALGCAMLAGKAAGVWDSMDEAVDDCYKEGDVIEPDMAKHEIYRNTFGKYKMLRSRLNDEYEREA